MGRPRKSSYYPDRVKDRTTCAPTLRLRDLLRLGNNPTIYRNLKQHLYRIAEKHLVTEFLISEQSERWAAIESELIETLPDIFEGSKNLLELALKVITSYHYRRRFASKQQQALSSRKSKLVVSVTVPTRAALEKEREAGKIKKENDINTLEDAKRSSLQPTGAALEKQPEADIIDSKPEDAKYDDKKKSQLEIVLPKLPLMTDVSNQLPGPSTVKKASRSASPLKFSSSQRPSTLGSSTAHINSQNIPLHAESSSQARSSNNASFTQGNPEDAFKLTGVTRVARFLNACNPPMAHFLQPFINFGCTSEEYLVAVSTWPTERILYFLKQVVSRADDDKRTFSQMDMLILQNHFISYFNKARA